MSQSHFSSDEIQLHKFKGLSLTGYSRAAHRTGLLVKGLNILLDAGLDVQKAFPHIFITHQHLDHVIYLPQYTMNIENPSDSINVISSPNILEGIKPYLTSALRMSKNIPKDITEEKILSDAKTNFHEITKDKIYSFMNGKDKWFVEPIKCSHGIESIGFGFSVEKIKLKEEYSSLIGYELKKLKDEGVEITYTKIEPIFLFLGDTNKNILTNDKIYSYPTIIIECTYIYDDEISLAKKNKHIHWSEIKEIIENKSHIQFILIHFSMKYTCDEIRTFFTKQNLSNLFYLI
jgi:ribonuclease Z